MTRLRPSPPELVREANAVIWRRSGTVPMFRDLGLPEVDHRANEVEHEDLLLLPQLPLAVAFPVLIDDPFDPDLWVAYVTLAALALEVLGRPVPEDLVRVSLVALAGGHVEPRKVPA